MKQYITVVISDPDCINLTLNDDLVGLLADPQVISYKAFDNQLDLYQLEKINKAIEKAKEETNQEFDYSKSNLWIRFYKSLRSKDPKEILILASKKASYEESEDLMEEDGEVYTLRYQAKLTNSLMELNHNEVEFRKKDKINEGLCFCQLRELSNTILGVWSYHEKDLKSLRDEEIILENFEIPLPCSTEDIKKELQRKAEEFSFRFGVVNKGARVFH